MKIATEWKDYVVLATANGEKMLQNRLNGPIMPSCESKTVQNDEFLSKLEQKLKSLKCRIWIGRSVVYGKKSTQHRFNAGILH